MIKNEKKNNDIKFNFSFKKNNDIKFNSRRLWFTLLSPQVRPLLLHT